MTHPGETCPECQRRVPYPKQKTSPQSKVVAYRIPLDDAVTHTELAEVAATELGILENKYWRWALHSYCYALILTGHRMEETGG